MKKNKNKKIDTENKDTLSKEKEINESSDEVSGEQDSLRKELELAIDDKKRALAEAENTRRRSIKDLEQSRKYGHLSLSREMLSVVDSLESAVNAIPKNKEDLKEELKIIIGKDYPSPIVEHTSARNAALEAFQSLKKN